MRKIFAKYISDRRLIFAMNPELQNLNTRLKSPVNKGVKEFHRQFSRKKQNLTHEYWKVVSILSHQEKES